MSLKEQDEMWQETRDAAYKVKTHAQPANAAFPCKLCLPTAVSENAQGERDTNNSCAVIEGGDEPDGEQPQRNA